MSRSRDGTWLTIRSPILRTPLEMSSSPATMRRAVVLPHPDGPTSTMNSPSWISRFRSWTAVVPSAYVFVTRSNDTPAIGGIPPCSAPWRDPRRLRPLRSSNVPIGTRDRGGPRMHIGGVMRVKLVTARPDQSAAEAIRTMLDAGVGSVLVVDGPELVGIFTERDVLRLAGTGASFGSVLLRDVMTSSPLSV